MRSYPLVAATELKDDDDDSKRSSGRGCKPERGRSYRRGNAASQAQLKMRAKFELTRYVDLYRKRKQVIEPIFGQIKGCPGRPGIRGFTVRGLENCRLVMLLQCAVHNLGKYLRHVTAMKQQKAQNMQEMGLMRA
jgi:hypothetical protein